MHIAHALCLVPLLYYKLDLKTSHALRFGLDHHILPRKIKRDEIKAYVEKLISSVKRHLSITKLNDDFKDQIKFCVSKFFKDSN